MRLFAAFTIKSRSVEASPRSLDTVAEATSNEYVTRLRRHEAAHFLTAYLVGISSKGTR